MNQDQRPQYYEGQYLAADDLAALVHYARVGQARHALGAHLWGIAIGLELVERALPGDGIEMVLTPGVAWDGYGRSLVALGPQRLALDLFANLQDDTVPEGIPVEVWLRYRELPASPPGVGFACPDDTLHGRVVETFRIELRRTPVADYHAVAIASRSIEARNAQKAFDAAKAPLYDESVPQQAFPQSGDNPPWPIFAGIVRWKKGTGEPGKLIKRTEDDRNSARKGRRYVGTVAETIVAPDGVLRLRDRMKDPDDPVLNYKPPIVAAPAGARIVNDLVWCEGHLRVIGDTRLQNGKLDYRVAKGGDDGVPMYLRRTFVSGPVAKTTLDAFIGPPALPHAQTRFTVSTIDGDAVKECLTVVTDGHVGIGTSEPLARLHLAQDAPLNAIFDRTDIQQHLTVVVGIHGIGLRFSDTGEFFVSSQPYPQRPNAQLGNEHLRIKANGFVGISEHNPQYRLDVKGTLHITGNAHKDSPGGWWLPSDAELKKDVEPIANPLDKLLGLHGVSFAWRDPERFGAGSGRYFGFVAQDVESVFPEWVETTPAGVKATNPAGLEALFVEAIRELAARCKRLEGEVAELRARPTDAKGSAPVPAETARPSASRKKAR